MHDTGSLAVVAPCLGRAMGRDDGALGRAIRRDDGALGRAIRRDDGAQPVAVLTPSPRSLIDATR